MRKTWGCVFLRSTIQALNVIPTTRRISLIVITSVRIMSLVDMLSSLREQKLSLLQGVGASLK